MSPAEEKTDDELLEDLAAHSPAALPEIVDRYLDSLYDFAVRTALDDRLASTSVLAALGWLLDDSGRPDGIALKPLLLGLTRDEVLKRSRRAPGKGPSGTGITDESLSRLPPEHPAHNDPALGLWAWQSARGQGPRGYSLLDMSVRQGLTPQEVGSATSASQRGIFAVLGRRRGLLEETFTATVLYRRGAGACAGLSSLIGSRKEEDAALSRDILMHLETCAECRDTMRGCPTPADLLAAFSPIRADLDTKVAAERLEEVLEPSEPAPSGALMAEAPRDSALFAGGTGGEAGPEGRTDEAKAELDLAGASASLPPTVAASELGPNTLPGESAVAASELGPITLPDESAVFAEPASAEKIIPGPVRRPSPPVAEVSNEGAGIARSPDRRRLDLHGRGKPPPRRPWEGLADWLGENGPARLPLMILLVAAMLLAGYLGLAIGDSLEGGSKTSAAGGLLAFPTSQPGVREIACGTGPIDVDQGSPITLSFDADGRIIPGFQITDVSVRAASATADPKSINAKAQQGLTMSLLAQPLAGAPGRTDEYRVNVTFAKSGNKAVSECALRVHAPLVAPAVAPTATSAPTLTPIPTARPAPVQPPSAPAPTSTTAPTAAPTNTATPTLTPTRTPTATPTRTPMPVSE